MTHTVTAPPDPVSKPKRPVVPHLLRILALPIVLFWIAMAVLVNVVAPPQLEVVGEMHSAPPMAPEDAPLDEGDEVDGGGQLPRVQLQQHDHDRGGGPEAPSARTRISTTTRSSASWSKTPSTSSISRTSGGATH